MRAAGGVGRGGGGVINIDICCVFGSNQHRPLLASHRRGCSQSKSPFHSIPFHSIPCHAIPSHPIPSSDAYTPCLVPNPSSVRLTLTRVRSLFGSDYDPFFLRSCPFLNDAPRKSATHFLAWNQSKASEGYPA